MLGTWETAELHAAGEVRQGAFSVSQPHDPILLSELLQLCLPKAEMRQILAYA